VIQQSRARKGLLRSFRQARWDVTRRQSPPAGELGRAFGPDWLSGFWSATPSETRLPVVGLSPAGGISHGTRRLTGHGIVFEVTRLLAQAGINITDLQTRLFDRVYALWIEATVPAGADGDRVAGTLHCLPTSSGGLLDAPQA
jgi:hypothetical protein